METSDKLDAQLQGAFKQARQPLPAQLEAALLAIPAGQALAAKRTRWAVSGASALAASLLFILSGGGRLLSTSGYIIGSWVLHLLNGAASKIYAVVVDRLLPWEGALPWGFTGAVAMLMAAIILTAIWAVFRPTAPITLSLAYSSGGRSF